MSKPSAQDLFAQPQDDELAGIEDEFGDDFGFGFGGDGDGEEAYEGDPNKVPIVPVPEEVLEKRSWDSLTVKWEPFTGQIVKKVIVQAMPHVPTGFDEGYDSSLRGGGKSITIKNPKDITEATVTGLKPFTDYVIRLVAGNDAGKVQGNPTPMPLKTLSYSPPRGDKSAWLNVIPTLGKADKTLTRTIGRRLSFRKNKPTRHWFVLEGALLTWYKKVDAEDEVGYVHLGKLKEISFNQSDDNTIFSLHIGSEKDEVVTIEAISERPDVTARDVFNDWVKVITDVRRQVGGSQTQVVRRTVDN